MNELKALKWFKSKYGNRNYAFTLRKFQAECIINSEKRYKVVDIYPEKIDGFYFIVYKKTAIKEKFYNKTYASIDGNIFEEHGVYLQTRG